MVVQSFWSTNHCVLTVLWHCRGCNEKGEETIPIEKIIKSRKDNSVDFITTIVSMIPHECDDKQVGIRAPE